jgi:hypothetical protein
MIAGQICYSEGIGRKASQYFFVQRLPACVALLAHGYRRTMYIESRIGPTTRIAWGPTTA